MKRILVVDDEPMSHRLIEGVIRVMGDYQIDLALSGPEALELARTQVPDLIISDINMPDMDGLTLCKLFRDQEGLTATPVLLLTARRDQQDKYAGFLNGADDFLSKPFDIMELQLRIIALLRRGGSQPTTGECGPTAANASVLCKGKISLNAATYTATVAQQDIRLTGSEMAILRCMLQHAGEVLKAELLSQDALGYPEALGNPRPIHTHMRNIRHKFQKAGVGEGWLSSSWQGYMLDPDPALGVLATS
jgi:DNA-binding response OmpR family regulator